MSIQHQHNIFAFSDDLIVNPKTKKHEIFFCFWLPVLILFFTLNIPADKYINLFNHLFDLLNINDISKEDWVDSSLSKSITLRECLFFYASIVLLFPIVKSFRNNTLKENDNSHVKKAFVIFFFLFFLIGAKKLGSMGISYGEISLDPFKQETGIYYRRLFVPALSYFLHFNGFLYLLFSFSLTYFLILTILIWFKLNNAHFKYWQLVSIFSSGYIFFQFKFPGYVDQLVLILAILTLLIPLSKYGRAACIAIMLSTHETAAFIIAIPLIFLVYPKSERRIFLSVFFLYTFFYLANFGFDIKALISAQINVTTDKTSFDYFTESPFLLLSGVFFAYKFLWIFVFLAICYLPKAESNKTFITSLTIVFFPFLQLPLGVDTSRLIAFGSLGIFALIVHCHRYMTKRVFNGVLFLNLLFPSLYVGLNTGPIWPGGLYKIYRILLPI